MTKYYSNKDDFPEKLTVSVPYASTQIVKLLRGIEDCAKSIKENDVEDMYVQTGDASLGKDMPEKNFTDAFDQAKNLRKYSVRVHGEIMQNIDSKFTDGLRNTFFNLSQNLNTDKFETKNLTYTETRTQTHYGGFTSYTTDTTINHHYNLTQILDGRSSPITAARTVYEERLKKAKDYIKNADKNQASRIKDYQNMSDEEIMAVFFGAGMGNQSAPLLKDNDWQEANREWLEPVEQYLGIGMIATAVVATVATGGAAAPAAAALAAAGTAYSLADSGYTAVTGNSMIAGTQQTETEQNWAAAEFVATAASLGATRYLGAASRAAKAASVTDDAVSLAHSGYNGIVEGEDQSLSLITFAGGKAAAKYIDSATGRQGDINNTRTNTTGPSVDNPAQSVTLEGKTTAAGEVAPSSKPASDGDLPSSSPTKPAANLESGNRASEVKAVDMSKADVAAEGASAVTASKGASDVSATGRPASAEDTTPSSSPTKPAADLESSNRAAEVKSVDMSKADVAAEGASAVAASKGASDVSTTGKPASAEDLPSSSPTKPAADLESSNRASEIKSVDMSKADVATEGASAVTAGKGASDVSTTDKTSDVSGDSSDADASGAGKPTAQDNILPDGTAALQDLRSKWGVPKTDTIAVGRTDVKGLEDLTFEGGSPRVRKEAGLPDLDAAKPKRPIKSPGKIASATRHAEEGVVNEFVEAVEKAGLDPKEVSGTLRLHQSNPKGVCPTCLSGLGNPNKSSGVIKLLSERYPNLEIKVTSEVMNNVRPNGRLEFTVKNGVYID